MVKIIKSKTLLPVLSLLIFTSLNFLDDQLEALINNLKKTATLYPFEKVHLQTDKPFYSVGEDIWFKAYIVDARENHLSDESKIMYVDLIDDRDSVRESLLLPVANGLASGNVHLSDSLLTAGNYHLIAYTKWMANFSSDYFFYKDISIVDALHATANANTGNRFPIPKSSRQTIASTTDVQFFPEGGRLVSGIRTKVGFKALKPDGLGEDVSGYITEDESREHLADLKSEHAGMGVFALTAALNKTYTAIIKHADGTEKSYPLPKANKSGYVLNINHLGDSISVRISVSPDLVSATKEVAVIAQSNGVVEFAAKVKMDKPSVISYIPAKKFRTGITQFTLFNTDYQPVAERLTFIDHHGQLTADLATDRSIYNKRDKVNLNLRVSDPNGEPVTGSFSITVTDEGKVKTTEDSETTIFSNLLLTSDIKGYIEQPGYYFNPENPNRQKQLDNLLLTQGWRRFSWVDLINNKFPEIKYPHEQSLAISGTITTMGNKPVPKGKVTLFATTGGVPLIMDTLADENGRYIFDNLNLPGSAKIIVRATSAKNSTIVKTTIDKEPSLNYHIQTVDITPANNIGLDNYLLNTRQQFAEQIKYGLMKNSTLLKEVEIKAKKNYLTERTIPHSANFSAPGNADIVLKPEKLEQYSNLLYAFNNLPGIEVSNNRLYAIRYSIGGPASKSMLIILDGSPIPKEMSDMVLSQLAPNTIAGVEILKSGYNLSVYGSEGAYGVVIVTTKRGDEVKPIDNSFNKQRISKLGYSAIKEFYSPAYDSPKAQTQMADLRSTVYWNPNVVTNAQGKANVSYFNADSIGTYNVTIEGMDTKGGLLRKTYTYVIK